MLKWKELAQSIFPYLQIWTFNFYSLTFTYISVLGQLIWQRIYREWLFAHTWNVSCSLFTWNTCVFAKNSNPELTYLLFWLNLTQKYWPILCVFLQWLAFLGTFDFFWVFTNCTCLPVLYTTTQELGETGGYRLDVGEDELWV